MFRRLRRAYNTEYFSYTFHAILQKIVTEFQIYFSSLIYLFMMGIQWYVVKKILLCIFQRSNLQKQVLLERDSAPGISNNTIWKKNKVSIYKITLYFVKISYVLWDNTNKLFGKMNEVIPRIDVLIFLLGIHCLLFLFYPFFPGSSFPGPSILCMSLEFTDCGPPFL